MKKNIFRQKIIKTVSPTFFERFLVLTLPIPIPDERKN